MGYATAEQFRQFSTFPGDLTGRLMALAPTFIQTRLDYHSASIDAQLALRYDTPFMPDATGAYPLILQSWAIGLTCADAWLRLGRASSDQDVQQTLDDATAIRAAIAAAADAEKGLYALPLRADNLTSGIVRPGPISYTLHSPFVGQRQQRERGRIEDAQGEGTYYRRVR